MTNSTKFIPLSASEIGTLWMTYQKKTMVSQMLRHFVRYAEDGEARTLLEQTQSQQQGFIREITDIFNKEGVAIPVGFGEQDTDDQAPALFNGLFEISFLRLSSKLAMGLHALHLGMSYRDDLRSLYRRISADAQEGYNHATQLLLERGLLARPPIVTPQRAPSFVQSPEYMSSHGILKKSRPINTVEIAHIYDQLEANVIGLELMTGFAQTAGEADVKHYFQRGKKLAEDITDTLEGILKESDMVPSGVSSGRTTVTETPVFSDKMMMYFTNLLACFSLGSNALGTSFSLRSDLPAKLGAIAAKVFSYAQDGGKLMAKHRWMEEPPQAENRESLTAVKRG